MTTAIWWVRRDLRLADNQALAAALAHAELVIPVFVLDPALLDSAYVGDKRLAFLFEGLRRLDADLRARGGRLVIRRGEPAGELAALVEETGAQVLFAEEDYTPYSHRRDARVAEQLPLTLTGGLTVHPPGLVCKADGDPYVVYTPYSRTWKRLPYPTAGDVLQAPEQLSTPAVEGLPIPDEPAPSADVPFEPGEAEAQRRLDEFVNKAIYRYAEARDRLDLDGTSGLSPYLHLGMISARQAVVAARRASLKLAQQGADADRRANWQLAQQGEDAARRASLKLAQQGAETWLDELIWREFYIGILHHFPQVLEKSFRPAYRDLAWENDEGAFAAWCEGRTGYPVVDAAMRQLVETGWMHNRARMIVASFLVKDLLIDWRWGERFFMQHLVDGDPAANNGNWQWTAGTGTDAAPYFRIFNPVLQGEKHDPSGAFVRRRLPELADVPDKYVHEPWKMPDDVQREAGCVVGEDYPAPIVVHAWARERTLAAYRRARESE